MDLMYANYFKFEKKTRIKVLCVNLWQWFVSKTDFGLKFVNNWKVIYKTKKEVWKQWWENEIGTEINLIQWFLNPCFSALKSICTI